MILRELSVVESKSDEFSCNLREKSAVVENRMTAKIGLFKFAELESPH